MFDLARFTRPASLAQLGGFRPPEDPRSSWAGRVLVAREGEAWPTTGGAPMLALAQLNLDEAPFVPPTLEGLRLITFFVGPHELPTGDPNGTHWELRAYDTLDDLVPLAEPEPARAGDPKARRGERPTYAALPIRWERVDDHPSRDDVPFELLADYDEADEADELPRARPGLKLGGWPLCVQSEVNWSGLDGVEFAIQVDSEDRIGFSVGFGGVLYLGRRPVDGTWHADWQSM